MVFPWIFQDDSTVLHLLNSDAAKQAAGLTMIRRGASTSRTSTSNGVFTDDLH